MESPTKGILEIFAKNGIAGLLIFVLIIFGLKFIEKLSDIQVDLQNIKIELVKVQNTIIDKAEIEKMINDRFIIHEAKYHNQ